MTIEKRAKNQESENRKGGKERGEEEGKGCNIFQIQNSKIHQSSGKKNFLVYYLLGGFVFDCINFFLFLVVISNFFYLFYLFYLFFFYIYRYLYLFNLYKTFFLFYLDYLVSNRIESMIFLFF